MQLKPIARTLSLMLAASMIPPAFAEDDSNIERIVIKGQKMDRGLQETTTSVGVITPDDIEKQNIVNVTDTFDKLPNVYGTFNQGFSIRGINAFNVSGSGNSFLTSMYMDGSPLPYRLVRQGGLSMWDVSQIEIFRGPQSTLQGRNALAGAIVIRSQDPTYEWSSKARVTLGENGQQEFAAAGGGALIEDQVAFRLSAEDRSIDGYTYNLTRQEDADFDDSTTYRAKLLIEPKAIDGLSAILSFTQNENKIGVQWETTGKKDGDRLVYFDSPIFEYTETNITNLELTYDINENWLFTSVTTYNESDYGYQWDGDATPEPIAELTYSRIDKTSSQELRLNFEYEKAEGLFGFYYSNLDVNDDAQGRRSLLLSTLGVRDILTGPAEFGGLNLPNEIADVVMAQYEPVDPVLLDSTSNLYQNVRTTALFADLTYHATDKLDLLFGLRYDEESQENSSDALYTVANLDLFPDPAVLEQADPQLALIITGLNQQLLAQAETASGLAPLSDAEFDAFLPKLGVNYKWSDDVSSSFIYQKGYRSGGVGTNIARAEVYTYEPEYTDNYEISLRTSWLGGDIIVNANAFYLDWSDQQVSIQYSPNNYDSDTQNSGKSTVKGFELETFVYLSKQLTVSGGIGLAKSNFDEFSYLLNGEEEDLSGYTFADSPEWTTNLAMSYEFDSGIYTNINANFSNSSRAYLNPETVIAGYDKTVDGDPKNDARTLVNIQVGYAWQDYKVALQVRNLFDEDYIQSYGQPEKTEVNTQPQMTLGTPRQASLSFSVDF